MHTVYLPPTDSETRTISPNHFIPLQVKHEDARPKAVRYNMLKGPHVACNRAFQVIEILCSVDPTIPHLCLHVDYLFTAGVSEFVPDSRF